MIYLINAREAQQRPPRFNRKNPFIQLGNLNQKLQGLRDKLKNDIKEDLNFMHFKMTQENHSEL